MRDKVVLITGAKGGLGTFVTQAFLDAGANVVGVSRSIRGSDFDHPRFTAFAAEAGGLEPAQQAVAAVRDRFGRVDALVHLVGGFAGGAAVPETDAATLDRMLDLNLRSAFFMAAAVLPAMRAQGAGRIVGVGSRAAVEPTPGGAAYAASKAALLSLIRSIAAENRDAGVTANLVLPGTMDTPANRAASPGADFSRWVQPASVAAVILSLASDAYGSVSGAAIPVYGGES